MSLSDFDRQSIAVIRGLAVDAPHAAKSGHQGTAVSLAPLAHTMWTRIMKFDPADPSWPDRDRFVLSAGHVSILQYSMLFLAGYGTSIDDLKSFRQWGSATPGHPEAGHTAGVEVTTGPLGQGIANAVGMALAERRLRAQFGEEIIDHHTYAIVSDGDLSEGVSHEAASLAGHQRLDRLVAIYDDNRITIDGSTDVALSDDVVARFQSYGWNVIDAGAIAEDVDALEKVINQAKAHVGAPTLIVLRTHIGFPSPTWADKPAAHGLCFDDATIAELKTAIGIPDEPFYAPDELVAEYRKVCSRGAAERSSWQERRAAFDRAAELELTLSGLAAPEVAEAIDAAVTDNVLATRQSSGAVLNAIAPFMPSLVIGSADLSGNTGTKLSGADPMSAVTPAGSQMFYGIREHAMGSAMVGMAMHGGAYPVAGTFLVFSDYMRPAVRLAALSRARCAFVWSHDSVAVGEDGPTHQPIEHVMSLRAIPDLVVMRPADAYEVAAMWKWALAHNGPVAVILSRQNVATLETSSQRAGEGVALGAYALNDVAEPDVILVGTGSEVSLAVDAAAKLGQSGISARVVSMPSWELFDQAASEYREALLPRRVATVSVEAGVTLGWHRFADECVGIDRFGASAPGDVVLAELGVTADAVVAAANRAISRAR